MDQHPAPNERRQYREKFRGLTAIAKKRWRQLLEQRFPGAITGVLSSVLPKLSLSVDLTTRICYIAIA